MKKEESARKKILNEAKECVAEMKQLDVGSEEYLNATKASNQLAEAAQKLKAVDPMAIVNTVVSGVLVIVTIAASEHHILDTRPVQFVRGLFRK